MQEKRTKPKLTILNQSGDYDTSMKILKENNLRPITYQEALSRSEELIKAFKGQFKWFYLAGKGIDKDGLFSFNSKGELKDLSIKSEKNPNKKVRVWSGNNPLSLYVYSDYDVAQVYWRFVLVANGGPSVVAPVVVGKPLEKVSSKSGKAQLQKLEILEDSFRCPKCKTKLKLIIG